MEDFNDLMSFVSPKYASGTKCNIDKIVFESTFIKFDAPSFENQNYLPKETKDVEVPSPGVSQQCTLVSRESFISTDEPKINGALDNSSSELTVDNLKNQKEIWYDTFPNCLNVTQTGTNISEQLGKVNNKLPNKDTTVLDDGTIRQDSVLLIFSFNDLNNDNFDDLKGVCDSETKSAANGIIDKEVELETARGNECVNNGFQVWEDCENGIFVSINNTL